MIVAASMLPTVAGAGGTTVTVNACVALPPAFAAVTVSVALPAATAVTVTLAPATSTVATASSEDSAVYASPAPAKYTEAVTVCVAPSMIVAAAMPPTVAGAGGTTVTANACVALPPAFVAVTVSVDSPAATAVTVTLAPAIVTVATAMSEDSAVYVSPAPAKWSEASSTCVPPSRIVTASMLPTGEGADSAADTVTAKACVALPLAFVAVTVSVASPAANPASASCDPDLETWTMPDGETVTS